MPTLAFLLLGLAPTQPTSSTWTRPIAAPDEFPKMEYTYVEASYVWLDSDSLNDKLNGWDLTGSFELPMNFFLQATVRQQSADADVDRYTIGAGWHFGLVPRLDAYGILQYQNIDVSGSGSDFKDDGVGAELGLRFSLTRAIELSGRYQWSDLDNTDSSAGVGARYYFGSMLSAGVNYDHASDDQTITAGVRFEL